MKFFRSLYQRLSPTPAALARFQQQQVRLAAQLETLQLASGALHSQALLNTRLDHINQAEFKVFSQTGEDGIIQYLIQRVPIAHDSFVEFGVEDYRESNTRFLLANNHWRGLIINSDTAHLDFVNSTDYGWRYDLQAVSAFITRDNINDLISGAGLSGDIGLLSVDLDGVDYWIWEAITAVSPRIVVAEYNSLFGAQAAVTVPYQPDFDLFKAHYSGLYWGASLAALCHLAERKGYTLVGCNRAGYNAFFVRTDVLGDLPALTAEQGYIASKLRTLRNPDGSLNRAATRESHLHLIADLPLVDVRTGQTTILSALRKG